MSVEKVKAWLDTDSQLNAGRTAVSPTRQLADWGCDAWPMPGTGSHRLRNTQRAHSLDDATIIPMRRGNMVATGPKRSRSVLDFMPEGTRPAGISPRQCLDDLRTPLEVSDWQDRRSSVEAMQARGYVSASDDGSSDDVSLTASTREELNSTWILNLSIRLKDKAEREKFFITYAEAANRWRRITVTIECKHAVLGSLEADIKTMAYQRDKSARIYDAIRDSLDGIKFYRTVTNLKLKTIDGRLHIHCTEDKAETIPYPHATSLSYLNLPRYRDTDVSFVSHVSGFVYHVQVSGRAMIKKEIPGPGSVKEFIYEVTALAALRTAQHVIRVCGLVVDDSEHLVTGVLLSFAAKGALIDLMFADRPVNMLPWHRREKWAWQIITGLSEVHEAGFVQGDLTLSNIVIDHDDDAWLIDLNHRGCPMGWEPPELETLIAAGQRISMFIGVKTDIFQLGMVLWALAMCVDEPEREPKPLKDVTRLDVPQYFKRIVRYCLQSDPRDRLAASDLLFFFPSAYQAELHAPEASRHSVTQLAREYEHKSNIVPGADGLFVGVGQNDRISSDASETSSLPLADVRSIASSE